MNTLFPSALKTPIKPGLALVLALVLAWTGWPAAAGTQVSPPASQSASGDILLSGKLTCALKQAVVMPFAGVITALPVQAGQPVTSGKVLARYRLLPEAIAKIRSRLSPSDIKELELGQVKLTAKLQELETRRTGLRQLARENLTSRQSLEQAEAELSLTLRERENVEKRLAWARQAQQDELVVLQKQLGRALNRQHIPPEGVLTAPLDGHVVWVNPDLRVGVQFKPEEAMFLIGTLDTMVVKSQVHELEAMRLQLGDPAEVEVVSLPGQKFQARVTRVSWSSLPAAADQPAFFEVEFSVPNPEHILKDGLKVRLTVPKATRS